ncbi:EAL domain-containing protein [Iamia sp. SCSIO 61187]|uniref:sensor domain-containing protein n=1 Tax=Iamia sp. SCSIO 61187 TaxID=2722752 RepID=UPI001C634077|nr:EAL domain-containing protein [Iamia sp. SCSIO 61187]QYG92706.1 EAL domain-containing protein [Iamia sp. SCSIO 61187]
MRQVGPQLGDAHGDDGDDDRVARGTDALDELRRAHAATARSERWLRTLLGSVSDAISVLDRDGTLSFTTGTEARFLGYSADEWRTMDIRTLVHPDDRDRALAAFDRSLASPGVEVSAEARVRAADGRWVDVAATGVNLLDDPEVRGIVLTTSDITDLRRAQRLASSQAAVLELIARGAPLSDVFDRCVALVEENGVGGRSSSIYLLDDDRLEMRAGRAPTELNDFMRDPPHDPPRSLCDAAFATGAATYLPDLDLGDEMPELRAVARRVGLRAGWSQPIVATGTGEVIGTLSTVYDTPHTPDAHEQRVGELACSLVAIAVERVATESRLSHQALHDGLTGLPNRVLLLDRLDHALERAGDRTSDLAVLFCDLDRFKVVNDSLGHGVGDQVLVAVADRLRATIDPGNTVARFGGDEFVVLLDDPVHAHDPECVAADIATAMAEPFVVPSGQEVHLTVSIGLAVAADHHTGDSWLRDADAAMYRAKDRGRDRMVLFDSDMRAAAVVRLQIENDLRRAVEREELVVHYQPVVDLAAGRIVGAEALVRWAHPEHGLLGPDVFIGVAEETGTIDEVGRWVLDRAVADVGGLVAALGVDRFQLGVNLSLHQLRRGDFDRVVDSTCRRHGWRPEDLLLEITETALSPGIDGSLDLLQRISALGVGLAIDDFGTGHSSLTRLGRMPVGEVKIDRSFVAAIDRPGARLDRIVDAVAALAGALDLQISAEGVETETQLAHVRRCGCHLAQGYLFSRPLPIDGFAALLARDPRW